MLNIVRVTIEGLPGSGKSTIADAISNGAPKGFMVVNQEDFTIQKKLIDSVENRGDIHTLVIVTETTPKAN